MSFSHLDASRKTTSHPLPNIPSASNVGQERVPQLLSAAEIPRASRRLSWLPICSRMSRSIKCGKAAAPRALATMRVTFMLASLWKNDAEAKKE